MGPQEKRDRIRAKVLEGLSESFPIKSRNKNIELADLHYDQHDFSPSEQKEAILKGDTLSEVVKGTVILKDAEGKVIDKAKNFTLARIPWFTPRHTLIVGGNEYSVSNMVRPKPGVYARKRSNGILEAQFNIVGGSNFNVSMDPEKGIPHLEYGSTKIPVYPILRKAGVSHEQIAESWGKKMADYNHTETFKNADKTVEKLYGKMVPEYARVGGATPDVMMQEILRRYGVVKMDPEVNSRTLGKAYETVTPHSILDASGKILRIFRQADEVDDRDNLDFKSFHSIEDFFKERIKLDARDIARKAAIKAEATPEIRKIIAAGPFTRGLIQFINSSQLVAVPTQTNPLELIDSAVRVTSLGEGGISTERAIPMEARQTHVTQIGALDPIRTPESFRAGIDIRAAMRAMTDSRGNLHVPIYDVNAKKHRYIRAGELQSSVVAFPNQEIKGTVDALVNGVVRQVPASKVQYQIPHPSVLYSPTTNLLPFLESSQGNRAIMGAKHQTQALSLIEREEPYVQVRSQTGKSFEKLMGGVINPVTPVSGTVVKVDKDYVYIKPHKVKLGATDKDAGLIKIPYETNFPLAAKTFLHHDITVKEGDEVKAGQHLGESNFTRNGTLALGKNMSVAYMPYHGYNSNDAVVISEGAAKKLTSERMYKIVIPRDPDLTFNKDKHQVYYGNSYLRENYKNVDTEGVIKPGTQVHPGEPVIFSLRKSQLTSDDIMLGRLHKSLARPYRDSTHTWEHDHPGEVIDVVKTPKRITVTVRTKETMGIGDKLCYAAGTDVLTATGWKPVEQVTTADICYTLNSEGIIELHKPTHIHAYPKGGDMYELKSQQVDLLVTINHSLLVQPRGSDVFELTEADRVVGKRVRHRKDGTWAGGTTPAFFELPVLESLETGKGCGKTQTAADRHVPIPMLDWLEFLGVYLANGSTTLHERKDRNGAVEYIVAVHSIKGQSHSVSGNQYAWIQSVLDKCGFSYNPKPDRFIISSKQLALYLSRFGKALDKYVPQEIFTYGTDAVEKILIGLLGCDGAYTQSGSLTYSTVSIQLAEDIQRLCLHRGWSANLKMYPQKNAPETWNTRFNVQIVQAKNRPQVNHGHTKTQKGQAERVFISDEPVYGLTIPNHTVYVRRNGKPVWCGNSGRYGNKGVVSLVLPDDQMIKDEAGKPIDILMTSAGVVSRINPSQIIESAVGKVVEKTGKPILVDNFTGKNNVKWAKDLLKEHGVKDKEVVTDPMTGKKIPGVFVGRQYIFKLFKSTDTNYSARGVDTYDVNQQPTKGGAQSAKAIGKMEFDALIGHNARNVLQESATIKSQKNDEYWRALQLGYPTPPPKAAFASDKFLNMLVGAGVRVHREGSRVSLAPLTDKDVLAMSSGEIKEPTLVRAKDLKPETGGLFDPVTTGGLQGQKWAHVTLSEPVVHPVFRDPVRRLLGMNGPQLDKAIAEKGGAWIQKELKKIDLDAKEKELLETMKGKRADQLDNQLKQVKYIRALKAQGLTPDSAYIINHVPVIPPVFRPVLPGRGGSELMYADVNPLYRDLVYVNNQFKEIKAAGTVPDEEKNLRPVLHAAVGAVFGTSDPITTKSQARGHKGFLTYIAGVSSPKYGYFQSKLMKRTQDVAGRGTIVPDLTLGMDEVGIPDDMLWTMWEKFIIKRLVGQGYSAIDAQRMAKDRHPAAKEAMMREMHERPVILNRAPSLHRFSMIAAYPRPVPGKTIRINPFMEKGFSADYDGDALQVYSPIGLKAVDESKSMTLPHLLFHDKAKDDLLVFPQHEAIMGVDHASTVDEGNKPIKFKTTADAMKAYHSNKIGLGTRVTIGD